MKSLRSSTSAPVKWTIDLLLTAGGFLLTYWAAVELEFPRRLSSGSPPVDAYLPAAAVIAVAFAWSASTFHLYRGRRAGSYWRLALDVLKVHLHLACVVLAIGFYYREISYSRQIITTFFALNPVLVFAHHFYWLHWERRRLARGIGTRSCLVVGTSRQARVFAEKIRQQPWTGLSLIGFVGVPDDDPTAVATREIVGELSELERLVRENSIQEVVVALPFRSLGYLAEIDDRLSKTSVGLRTVLDLDAFNTLSREITEFENMPVINLRGVRTYGLNAFLKRGFDLVVSGALLIALAPLMLGIALIVWIQSGRPIFFRQERVGLDGSVFPMFKFRTMVDGAESKTGPVFADTNDARCTRIGALLRRTSLDELPQLWNIVCGHMSLVGPRPERPVFIEEFREQIPRYMLRHHMKAGLTGWAQIHGWRGKTSLTKRLQYDLYYLRNWSLWLDVKILLLTLVRAWREFTPIENRKSASAR